MADFIGIGAQKAGTTWLYKNLRAHPGVWFPLLKEIHYFDSVHLGTHLNKATIARKVAEALKPAAFPLRRRKADTTYLRRLADPSFMNTDAWYRHIFSAAPKGAKAGEITPLYCAIGADGVAHVKRLLPDVRLIYIVRDPLERALSAVRMVLGRGGGRPAADPLALICSPLFLGRGDYRSNIPLWDAAFGDSVLYLPFGWIRSQPGELLGRVESFLSLSRFSDYPRLDRAVHVSPEVPVPPAVKAALEGDAEPQMQFIRERFGADFLAACR